MEINKLVPVLKRVFPKLENIDASLLRKDIEEWDSINHLNLIIELEDEFSVSFSTEEIKDLGSVQQIIDLISQKLIA
jgi:acyl carrier protein